MALVYVIIVMSAMIGMVSLAVDLGSVQTAKTQAQAAADSAALYAAEGLVGGTPASVRARAKAAAADNTVNGASVVLTDADIVFGIWDSSARNFEVLTGTAGIRRHRRSGHRQIAPTRAAAVRSDSPSPARWDAQALTSSEQRRQRSVR